MIQMIQMWKYGRHALKLLMTTAMLIGLGGIYAASPAPVVEAGPQAALPAGTLWSAGQETGDLSEWSLNDGGGIFNTGTGVASATSSLANSGRNAAALTISNAANATQAVRLFRWSEPRETPEAYYSIWLYFPQTYAPTSWWNIEQWKSKMSETINDPLWTLNVGNRSGQMYLYLYDWLNGASVSQQTVHYLPVGKWFHLETFYRQATDKTGQITMWQDGAKILDVSGVSTKRVGDEVQWSVDNYTDSISPSDATIYLDDAVISTTRIGDPAAQPAAAAQPTATATAVPPTPPSIPTTPTVVPPSPTVAPAPANQLLADGPLAYWRLGEKSGTVAADSSGHGYEGQYVGTQSLGTDGAVSGDADGSVTFGTCGYVEIPRLPSATDFTVEGWSRLDPSAVNNPYGNNGLYRTWEQVSVIPRPGQGSGFLGYYASVWINGSEYSLQGDTPSNLNTWVHWAVVRQERNLTVYRNGQVVGQRANLPSTGTANVQGHIGYDGTDYPLRGQIDEVAVYNRALTAAQVQSHYGRGLPR